MAIKEKKLKKYKSQGNETKPVVKAMYDLYPPTVESEPKEILISFGVAFVCLVLVVLIVSHFGGVNQQGTYPSGNTVVQTTENTDTDVDSDVTEYTDTTEIDSDVAEGEDEDQSLPYTDNAASSIQSNLDPADFNTWTADEGYSFVYPMYLFTESGTINDTRTGYYFTDNENYTLEIYTADDVDGVNPGDQAKSDFEYYKSQFVKVAYERCTGEVDENGFSRAIVSGHETSSDDYTTYMVIANDGNQHYIYKFKFLDNIDEDLDDGDYINDCIYRGCSFSGATYQLRTYEQFKNGDMGSKK